VVKVVVVVEEKNVGVVVEEEIYAVVVEEISFHRGMSCSYT
jgi:hypothetical protein